MQVAHHGVKFHHRIADRGAGGKDHAAPAGDFIQIPALRKHIGRFLRFGLADSRHIPHFCCQKQVFESVGFVHKQLIDAQFLKGNHIILATLVI